MKEKAKSKNTSKPASKDIAKDAPKAMPGVTGKIRPLADRVIIKEDAESAEQKTSSGIIIPVTVADDKGGKRGVVMAVGPGRMEDGELVALSVKPGDKVLFQWGDKVRLGEDDYYIVRESEILAIIK